MKTEYFSIDVTEFLSLLDKHKVHYLIVGGEAVIYYGHARLTGDIDIFYKREIENSIKLFFVLKEFWRNNIPGIADKDELMKKGMIFQFGVPPNRIDLINVIEGVEFDNAWKNKKTIRIPFNKSNLKIYYIGLEELIKNKKAVSRYRDKEDLKFLNKLKKNKK